MVCWAPIFHVARSAAHSEDLDILMGYLQSEQQIGFDIQKVSGESVVGRLEDPQDYHHPLFLPISITFENF